MDDRHFHYRLHETARRLIPRRSVVLCAISGGADSVAMLSGLVRVNEIHDCQWTLHVAHLNHELRQEAADDAGFVRSLSDAFDLPCFVETRDVRAAAAQHSLSIEAAARECRLEFLNRIAEELSANVVTLAHHADDQAETILHRILRGTGLHGLAGMPDARPICEGSGIQLVRPMLCFRRVELRDYLSFRGIQWREDGSNLDSSIATRNRIRHDLLPMIEKLVNPRAADSLVQLGALARDADEAMRAIAHEAFDRVLEEFADGTCALHARGLAALPPAIQSECIRILISRLGVGLQEIGAERIGAALNLLQGDGDRRRVEFPKGIIVERRGDLLRIGGAERLNSAIQAPGTIAEATNP